MRFTSLSSGNRPDAKAAQFAVVAALHVALGAVFIHSLNVPEAGWPSWPSSGSSTSLQLSYFV